MITYHVMGAKNIEPMIIRAETSPGSVDRDKRTFDVVFSTGSTVRRSSWSKGPYNESLAMGTENVRLDRLNSGAPLLDSHMSSGVSAQLGVVESASVDGTVGTATVRFPAEGIDERSDLVFNKVEDSIIRNVSVGYRVHKYEISEKEGEIPEYRAVDWEPFEISLTPIGADPGAGIRSGIGQLNRCEFFVPAGEERMEEEEEELEGSRSDCSPSDVEHAVAAERNRSSEIRKMCSTLGIRGSIADRMISDGTNIDDARGIVIDLLSEKQRGSDSIDNHIDIEMGRDLARVGASDGLRNALENQGDSSVELTDAGRMFRGVSMLQQARQFLSSHGENVDGWSDRKIARTALGLEGRSSHSTSDFPLILANVAGNTMRRRYTQTPQTFKKWCYQGELKDFNEVTRIQSGDFPQMEKVLEGGTYTLGTFSESGEKIKLSKYGRRLAFTWEMMVNDSFGEFNRMMGRYGFAISALESNVMYDHILSNPNMADGVPLFHANHANVGTGPIGIQGYSDAQRSIMDQKTLDGYNISIPSRYVIVPTTLQTVAIQFGSNITANKSSDVNPFYNMFEPLTEPRLNKVSTVEWYMTGDPGIVDTAEYSYLRGQEGPMISNRVGFEIDGLEIKVSHVFAVKAMDHRGIYKSSGV